MTQKSHVWAYTPEEMKAECPRAICTPMFLAAFFTMAKRQK